MLGFIVGPMLGVVFANLCQGPPGSAFSISASAGWSSMATLLFAIGWVAVNFHNSEKLAPPEKDAPPAVSAASFQP